MRDIAPVWQRVVAGIIDAGIFLGVILLLVSQVVGATTIAGALDRVLTAVLLAIFVLPIINLGHLVIVSRLGGSVGKLLTGIKIVDSEGKNLSFGGAFMRQIVGYFASGAVLWAGFIWVFIDKEKQGWHDQIAGSYVVVSNQALAFIGLVAAIAIIGFNTVLLVQSVNSLTANLPMYQDFWTEYQKDFKESAEKAGLKANPQTEDLSPEQKLHMGFNKATNETKDLWESEQYAASLEKANVALSMAQSDEEKAIGHYWIGLNFYRMKNLAKAETEMKLAAALDSTYSAPHVTLAAIAGDQGRKQEAMTQARLAVKLDPNSAWAHNALGIALLEAGRKIEGVAEFKKAIALDPKNQILRDNLAQAEKF